MESLNSIFKFIKYFLSFLLSAYVVVAVVKVFDTGPNPKKQNQVRYSIVEDSQ